ncbi:MAG: DUF2520 domain-containing protein [Myxococcales bacterium]|nr:DUF2520 domain-containing protein [Myxococcales bacterium]
MSTSTPTLAVLGGSFNPPHLGHALLPRYLLASGVADRVLVAPCADHPLGKRLTAFPRRMSWTRLALGSELDGDLVEVSPIEAELAAARDGRPSYTLELLEALEARHPDERIRLVVGSDITRSGETDRWHRWDRIVARFDPIIVPRAGWCEAGEASLPEISSTLVRETLDALRATSSDAERRSLAARLRTTVPAAVASALLRWIDGDEPRVWVVGHGHVAAHVVPWLWDRGFEVVQLGARELLAGGPLPEAPPIGAWLLARDGDLPALAAALAGRLPTGLPVLHAAGARPAREVLAPLVAAGHSVGTLHPIGSFRRERRGSRLRRASFGLAGSGPARDLARALVGDRPVLDLQHLDARGRMAYHAACALVANHQAVIEEAALTVLLRQGFEQGQASEALGELMLGALENLLELGIPDGVTGPLSRGDQATVASHVAALESVAPDAGELYAQLSARLARMLVATRSS